MSILHHHHQISNLDGTQPRADIEPIFEVHKVGVLVWRQIEGRLTADFPLASPYGTVHSVRYHHYHH
jgi:hypothetical protein